MATKELKATPFRFEGVESQKGKDIVFLCRTDRLVAAVQVVNKGGENNLHRHDHLDGFWYVLKGRVIFYTTDDEIIGTFGPGEGILVPRGFPYWFEKAGKEQLELLQVECSDMSHETLQDMARDRIDMSDRPDSMAQSVRSGGLAASGADSADNS